MSLPKRPAAVADVAVVGMGIVGLSCAWHLRQRGANVLMVDAKGPAGETSFGNAGSISVGNLMPQATPGIVGKGLRMLLDPDAPLKLDWPALPTYARWLLDFVRAGRRNAVLPVVDALHAINHASRAAWLELAAAINAMDLVDPSGYLHVYAREASFEAGAWERALMRDRGVAFEVLDARQLRELEPDIGADFERAVFQTEALAMRDPGGFCQRLHAALVADGVEDLRTRVIALQRRGDAWVLDTAAGPVAAAQVVVAAGAWAPRLLAPLGLVVPVVPARGYHLMFAPQPRAARRPTLWAERYMVMTPMKAGVRVTSIKELTALDRAPRFGLVRRLVPAARTLYPALQGEPSREWAGFRPCTPDSLPIIDAVDGLHLALGHGHLGLTQGPVTGAMVAARVAGGVPAVSLSPFRLGRFRPRFGTSTSR
ncbi:FAD-binding oxidoreductase [Silanimonas sp.]|uniref:NAD(P)/FAD-dependent oxidoreductase n=1 Tax=Silanimonas sp. TaxID=1929290 RepID=UPI0022C6F343|nr:FAD-binding oxidoreductase [Silanimonas sp.]MCZ8165720.1 FAD-binding oxidoreductase [Silanimonas sp.]